MAGLKNSLYILAASCFGPLLAQSTTCAKVKIQIVQELTLERQGFDAHMRIHNGLDLPLEQIDVDVSFTDRQGQPVIASSDPNHPSALFFIALDEMQNIADVNGSGRVAPETTADVHWLIIPAPGASNGLASGTLYFVGATLSYALSGETQTIEVTPDSIAVLPMPELRLDYFLPVDVYADNAQTPEIEAAIPFKLGVRVRNDGHGTAHNLKIESSQPRIVENTSGLNIGFEIIGSSINGRPGPHSLIVDFGDIEPGSAAVGAWLMQTNLSGRFTEFYARFTHADELGGELTSLIDQVHTHLLIQEVEVDLPGRDQLGDFLAFDGTYVTVFESDNQDTVAQDLSASSQISGSGNVYHVSVPPHAGFSYVRLSDPTLNTRTLRQVVRGDGKVLLPVNAWQSQTFDQDTNRWAFFLSLFDTNALNGSYTLYFDGAQAPVNQAPILASIGAKTARTGQTLAFQVSAHDPNGTIPSLATGVLPMGASFTDLGTGIGQFSWRPAATQLGQFPVKFTASDGELGDFETISITVTDQNPPNQAPVAENMHLTLDEDTILQAFLAASDPDGDPLTFTILDAPGMGTLTLLDGQTGLIRYQPDANAHGADQFRFMVSDGELDSGPALVQWTVRPVNDPPSSAQAFIETLANTVSQGVTPQVDDPDEGDVHTFSVETVPQHGNAWVQDNQLFYEPEPDFVGTDAFTFRATDALGLSVVGTAQVTVRAPEPDFQALRLVCADQDPTSAQLLLNSGASSPVEQVAVVLHGVTCTGSTLLDRQVLTLLPGENAIDFAFDLTGWDETTVLLAGLEDGNQVSDTNPLNDKVSRAIRVGPTPMARMRQVWTQNPAMC